MSRTQALPGSPHPRSTTRHPLTPSPLFCLLSGASVTSCGCQGRPGLVQRPVGQTRRALGPAGAAKSESGSLCVSETYQEREPCPNFLGWLQ